MGRRDGVHGAFCKGSDRKAGIDTQIGPDYATVADKQVFVVEDSVFAVHYALPIVAPHDGSSPDMRRGGDTPPEARTIDEIVKIVCHCRLLGLNRDFAVASRESLTFVFIKWKKR